MIAAGKRITAGLRFGLLLLGAGCLGGLIGSAAAADWPMDRGGPQLQGVANAALPAQVRVEWSYNAGAPIKGSAAIVNNRVYVGDDAGTVHAVSADSGKVLWTFKTEGGVEGTPLVLNGVVYVGSADFQLYALDAASGAMKWKYATTGKIVGGANHARSPDDTADWLIVGSHDYSLYCVDAASGKLVWSHATENYINGTPTLLKSGEIVIGGCDAAIHVLSLKDGSEVRQIETAMISSSVAAYENSGYVGNHGNQVVAFDLKAGSQSWLYRDRNFPYQSSPAITAERVVIGGGDRQLHCLERLTGKAVWKFSARRPIDGSPVICGDSVVVGSVDGRLYCVALADGKERWAYDIGAKVSGSPAVADGRIIIGAEDGKLYSFVAALPAAK